MGLCPPGGEFGFDSVPRAGVRVRVGGDPTSQCGRVLRGGSWNNNSNNLRAADPLTVGPA